MTELDARPIHRALVGTLAALCATAAAALLLHACPDALSHWARTSLGGTLYVIFWCLVFSLAFRRARPWLIALCVLAGTCALEFLQLWHQPVLESFRRTFAGRLLIGADFSWADFPYYATGCLIGWLLVKRFIADRSPYCK